MSVAKIISQPLSLYVHIPWCVRKCPYCDFNSHKIPTDLAEDAYVTALLADLEQDLPLVWGRKITSIFIGGGTPSLFSAEALNRLLSGIRALLPISVTAEITMEANPGTVEQSKFTAYRQLGINRLSIGVQSFQDQQLTALGRIHNAKEAITAIETAQQAGFKNINLDLMFGLPQQDLSKAIKDVQTAISLVPQHISYYQLTLEPNTAFYQTPPRLPEENIIDDIQQKAQTMLAEQGYLQYEVSAYAKDHQHSHHNINYWQFGDYLGIGAGAHAKISDMSTQLVYRYAKLRHPQAYMKAAATPARIQSQRQLHKQDLTLEYMMNALRLSRGLRLDEFESRTGIPKSALEEPLKTAEAKGFIKRNQDHIQPTELGQRFLNDLVNLFA